MISGQALEVSRHHDQRLEVSHFIRNYLGAALVRVEFKSSC